MVKLLVNGDDFGLTMGVSKGIIDAIKNGIMGDTTAMANMESFDESIKLAMENGINEMGIHLTMTCGKPILPKSEVSTIVDENGYFFKKSVLVEKIDEVDFSQIEKEMRAQINRFLESGMKMNHMDSHHHFYAFDKRIFSVVAKLAKEFNIPMRCPMNMHFDIAKEFNIKYPDVIVCDFFGDNVSEEFFLKRLQESIEEGHKTIEFMAHPAYADDALTKISSYTKEREEELRILKSESVKEFLNKNNIEIISFSNL